MKQETDFDQMISSHEQEILKAALPFFPYSEQKFLSIFIRMNELIKTMELFANDTPPLRICTNEEDDTQSLELMVQTLKEFCTPSEQEILDLFFNIKQAIHLYEESLDNSEQATASSPLNLKELLCSFLSPEQSETLQMIEMLQLMQS